VPRSYAPDSGEAIRARITENFARKRQTIGSLNLQNPVNLNAGPCLIDYYDDPEFLHTDCNQDVMAQVSIRAIPCFLGTKKGGVILLTRGPQPLLAIDEARDIGSRIGTVAETRFLGEGVADLVFFCMTAVVFVKIKRTRTQIRDTLDIIAQYRREIARLRRIPGTPVVSRELWVRQQRGSWLFYRIHDDTVIEIGSDVAAIPGPPQSTVK
jgi:hypothetical protein